MTRLLFLGDLAGTGFGTVTRDLGRALLARGLDVRFVSMNEGGDLEEPFASRTASLGQPDGWLADTARRLEGMVTGGLFEDGWRPEAVLVTGDPASFKISPVLRIVPAGFPLFHYVPIEGVGLPPRWAGLWEHAQPVAMSRFGADQLRLLLGREVPLVYHGVDTDIFYPVSASRPIVFRAGDVLHVLRSRKDCKRFLGWEGTVIFRADRHMPRKNYASLLRSCAPVLARHPNARLIWHCGTLDQGGDLADERSKYPPPLARRMQTNGFIDQYGGVPREVLAAMYNAADIYASTSAEGFGLTIAEAIACGTPAVGMDFSAVPEVIGPAGRLVPPAGLVDNIYSHFWAIPDEVRFAATLDDLVSHVLTRRTLGSLGPAHVREHFSWAAAAESFAMLIEGRLAVAA